MLPVCWFMKMKAPGAGGDEGLEGAIGWLGVWTAGARNDEVRALEVELTPLPIGCAADPPGMVGLGR